MPNTNLWEKVLKLDPEETAKNAKCVYLREEHCYQIQMLSKEYLVNLNPKTILLEDVCGFNETLILLSYLLGAQNIPLKRKLVRPENLPSGQFFFRGLHEVSTEKLEKSFGDKPDLLIQAGKRFNAKFVKYGDAAIELLALPRIPVTLIVWGQDEEFSARGSVLVDQTAAEQMALDALWATLKFTISQLIDAVTDL